MSKNLYENLPETPGIYIMKGAGGRVLYVGKAGNLYRRVSSYFLRPHDARIERLVALIRFIDHEETDSALEALILEARRIKELTPPFNIREKDDKSFLYVEITNEPFPGVLLVRGKDIQKKGRRLAVSGVERFGPFTSSTNVRQALKIIRRIFPWNTHPSKDLNLSRAELKGRCPVSCLDYEIGLCPGTCIGAISKKEYAKTIRNIKLFFEGKKRRILASFRKEMEAAARKLDFEHAEELKRKIFALEHIRDIAFIGESDVADVSGEGTPGDTARKRIEGLAPRRIEGYDISNISGTSAVGAMVVSMDGKPAKDEYRKFKIHTVRGSDDVGMMREVLRRRFARHASHGMPTRKGSWPLPDLVLIDGGRAQVNVAHEVLEELGFKIPVLGIAKGPDRKKNEILGSIPPWVELKALIRLRDEAHRFAVSYHRALRRATIRA